MNLPIDKYKDKSRSWLDAELWRVFSLWVRQKDADHKGIVKCVTCGAYRHWRYVDTGHYISRRHMSTKFLLMNTAVQCKKCNGPEGGGKPSEFARYIDKKHGLGTALYLERISKHSIHITRIEYIQQIENFKHKLRVCKLQLK